MSDKEWREKMGREGVAWARNFDWNKTSDMFLSVISKDLPAREMKLLNFKQTL